MDTAVLLCACLILTFFQSCSTTPMDLNCPRNAAPQRFRPLDPSCHSVNSSLNGTSWQLTTDSQLTCVMACALSAACKYFSFSASNCTLSSQPGRMTHRKLDPRFSVCQEVCINSRRFCIVQQRLVDTVNFSRAWPDYENGFGDAGDFWIGLRMLSLITAQSSSLILRAEMRDWNNSLYVAEYMGFVVQNGSTNYTMNYTQFLTASSNVSGDSLTSSKGKQFSTLDRDNDDFGSSCSTFYHGGAGWWFGACTNANPNGLMTTQEVVNYSQGIHWVAVHRNKNSLKTIRLLVQLPD